MPNYLATATLTSTSAIPKDAAVNTFAIAASEVGVASSAHRSAMADAIVNFYNGMGTLGESVAYYLAPNRSRAAGDLVIRIYDITGKEQRVRTVDAKGRPVWRTPNIGSPISTYARTLGAAAPGGFSSLPAEVACVLSLRTANRDSELAERPDDDDDDAVDRPRARNTGRIFLGPLGQNALGSDTAGDRRVAANLRTALVDAAQRLKTGIRAINVSPPDDTYAWGIWSRADGNVRRIEKVVVDDAFDTMRKRGVRAQATSALTLA